MSTLDSPHHDGKPALVRQTIERGRDTFATGHVPGPEPLDIQAAIDTAETRVAAIDAGDFETDEYDFLQTALRALRNISVASWKAGSDR